MEGRPIPLRQGLLPKQETPFLNLMGRQEGKELPVLLIKLQHLKTAQLKATPLAKARPMRIKIVEGPNPQQIQTPFLKNHKARQVPTPQYLQRNRLKTRRTRSRSKQRLQMCSERSLERRQISQPSKALPMCLGKSLQGGVLDRLRSNLMHLAKSQGQRLQR